MEGPENPPAPGAGPRLSAPPTNTTITTSSPAGALSAPTDQPEIQLPKVTIRRDVPKVGRNEPCPCGSGKKYKQCHGK
jgi:preprotein translocase subunit SecA